MNNDYPSTKPQLTAADFHGNAIRLIEKDGERWLTARDLGLCLGYNEANSKDGIIKLYNRHLDEFTDKDSVTVKLTATDGKAYDTRIFSPGGCFLLSFFANTHRAKEFRAWAKEVLVRVNNHEAELAALRAENRRLYWLVDELQDAYTKTHGDALKLLRYRRLGLSSRECAQLLGCSVRSISRRLARLKQLGFGEQQALPLAAPQGSRLRFADGEV
jgi:putative phage anti-repressor protein